MEIYNNVSFNKSNSSRGSPGKGVGLTRQNSILTDDFSEYWPCHIQRPITWEVFMSSHWNFLDKEQKKEYLRNYRICTEILFIFSAVELSLNFPIVLGLLELPRLTIYIAILLFLLFTLFYLILEVLTPSPSPSPGHVRVVLPVFSKKFDR